MKDKKAKQKEKKAIANNKLLEKKEKLKELDLEKDKQRKLILKKIHKWKRKKWNLKKKEMNLLEE